MHPLLLKYFSTTLLPAIPNAVLNRRAVDTVINKAPTRLFTGTCKCTPYTPCTCNSNAGIATQLLGTGFRALCHYVTVYIHHSV